MLLFALKSCPHLFHFLKMSIVYSLLILFIAAETVQSWTWPLHMCILISTDLQGNFVSIRRNWPCSSPWDCSSVLSNTMGSSFGTWCNKMLGRSAATDVAHITYGTANCAKSKNASFCKVECPSYKRELVKKAILKVWFVRLFHRFGRLRNVKQKCQFLSALMKEI